MWLPENQRKFRSSHQRCSVKKDVLRNFAKITGKHLCQSLFFNKVTGVREISKNTFFTEHVWATASLNLKGDFNASTKFLLFSRGEPNQRCFSEKVFREDVANLTCKKKSFISRLCRKLIHLQKQQFADALHISPVVCNFAKKETPAKVFSWGFLRKFQKQLFLWNISRVDDLCGSLFSCRFNVWFDVRLF